MAQQIWVDFNQLQPSIDSKISVCLPIFFFTGYRIPIEQSVNLKFNISTIFTFREVNIKLGKMMFKSTQSIVNSSTEFEFNSELFNVYILEPHHRYNFVPFQQLSTKMVTNNITNYNTSFELLQINVLFDNSFSNSIHFLITI